MCVCVCVCVERVSCVCFLVLFRANVHVTVCACVRSCARFERAFSLITMCSLISPKTIFPTEIPDDTPEMCADGGVGVVLEWCESVGGESGEWRE